MQSAIEDLVGARSPGTSFIGRREELNRLRALIPASRVVTITGSGGSGKTRLAEELVGVISRSFGGGIAVAYLADSRDGTEVADLVAAAVGLRGAGDQVEALTEYLADRRYLLLLDNCEHVSKAAADLVATLLRTCPGVSVLATSRRALLVPGEQLFPIGGLQGDTALALFTDRVRLASPSFVLTPDQRPVLRRLCDRLDGMPLAIELTAARLRHVGLVELEARMSGRLADIGTAASAGPARQRTLRETIDWSHDLLSDDQRVLWRRLCLFSGGFTLEAAEVVASFPPLVTGAIERLLGDLVDGSMVAFDLGSSRYRIIEAMREYGLERLREADEYAATTGRHRAWMLERAEDLNRRWWGPDQARALDEIAADASNLRAALEGCRIDRLHDDALRMATGSLWYWMTRASYAEAIRWLVPFLDHATDASLGARGNMAAAWIAILGGRIVEASRFIARAEAFAVSADDATVHGYIRSVKAFLQTTEGHVEAATALCKANLVDPNADEISRSWAMINLGIIAYLSDDLETCARLSAEGLAMCRAAGETWTQVPHLHLSALAKWQAGDAAGGVAQLLEALGIDRRLDDLWHRAWTIEGMAWMTVDLGRYERAARLLGIATGCWEIVGARLTPPWQVRHDRGVAELRRRLGAARLEREIEAGRQLDPVRALSFALEDAEETTPTPLQAAKVTPRELEVAGLLAAGLSNREVGEQLFLSPRTVETHVQHLMDKLGVGSRAEIAAWHAREIDGPASP